MPESASEPEQEHKRETVHDLLAYLGEQRDGVGDMPADVDELRRWRLFSPPSGAENAFLWSHVADQSS